MMFFVERMFTRFDYTFDFMQWRYVAAWISGGLTVICLLSLLVFGLRLGIDFTGGTLIEVVYAKPVELPSIREKLGASGFPDAVVQHFGTAQDVMIRLKVHPEFNNETLSNRILALLQQAENPVSLRRVEFVGAQVGDELVEDGGLAVLYTLFGILIYVAFRFEWRFALGAVLALAHDTVLTVGFFSLLGLEFDLVVLAAVLAVIGYSLNDSVVVFDRIRENFLKHRKKSTIEVLNLSINETLSRTIMTGVTTLMVLLVLFFFGGQTLFGFSTALIVGVTVGTYSSVYVASVLVLFLGISRKDLLPLAKEGSAAENRD